MSDIIDINVAQTVEEITINATPNLIEVNINNMNAGKHSDLVLDDGTNPHGTTKTDVGLSNVPNLDTTNAVNLAHTHSNFTALNALSGTNTGDETTLSIQTKRPIKTINNQSLEGSGNIEINVDNLNLEGLNNVTSTNYTTPIDTDSVLTFDITTSLWKRLSWLNIKSNLKTYFDSIYTTTSAVANQISTALVGYATESFVTSQGYITNVITALGFTPENVANKSTSTSLGTSDTLYPTQNAVKVYADTKVDKVTTAGVERAYIINADGSQGTKATSEFGGSESLLQVKGFATDFPVSNLIGTSAPMSNIGIASGTADYNRNLIATSETGHQGIVALRSSTSTNSGFCFFYGGAIVNNGDKHVFFTQFKLPTVTDVKGYVGAHSSTTTAEPTSACFLEIVNNSGVFKTRGTVLTTSSTSFTLDVNTWYNLMIEFKSTTEVYFKIKLDNGTVVADFTSTTNLPLFNTATFSAVINMFSTVATAARDLMLLDYVEYRPNKPNHLKTF